MCVSSQKSTNFRYKLSIHTYSFSQLDKDKYTGCLEKTVQIILNVIKRFTFYFRK